MIERRDRSRLQPSMFPIRLFKCLLALPCFTYVSTFGITGRSSCCFALVFIFLLYESKLIELLTLRRLRAYIFLDQGICRLSIKAESVFERFHIGALLEEGFLQPISSSVEILLRETKKQQRRVKSVQAERMRHLRHHRRNFYTFKHGGRRVGREQNPGI